MCGRGARRAGGDATETSAAHRLPRVAEADREVTTLLSGARNGKVRAIGPL